MTLETERLRLTQTTVTSWIEDGVFRTPTGSEPRVKFTARLKTDDSEVGHAIVWDQRHKEQPILFRLYCQWMEVTPGCQQQGYGQELYEGIERYLGGEQMEAIAVTEAGKALLRKMNRPIDALSRHLTQLQPLWIISIEVVSQQGNQQQLELFTKLQADAFDTSLAPHERMQAVTEMTRQIDVAVKTRP